MDLDLESWPRRALFEWFRPFEQPFFDVTVPVDVENLHEHCRAPGGPPFSIASLYLSLHAANGIENFRHRLRGDRVITHDVIHGTSTVLKADGSFNFSYFDWQPDFQTFARDAQAAMARAKNTPGLWSESRDDLIYYSILPWLAFTSFGHARRHDPNDSVPRLVFGKYQKVDGRRKMPVALALHHALADGLHAGWFFERFQAALDDPGAHLGSPNCDPADAELP